MKCNNNVAGQVISSCKSYINQMSDYLYFIILIILNWVVEVDDRFFLIPKNIV